MRREPWDGARSLGPGRREAVKGLEALLPTIDGITNALGTQRAALVLLVDQAKHPEVDEHELFIVAQRLKCLGTRIVRSTVRLGHRTTWQP
jgi:hypothetical protein